MTHSTASLAAAYSAAANAAASAAVDAEAEAQLTVPVSNLFTALVELAGPGRLQLIRETRLDRTRPDFAAIHLVGPHRYQKGFVELKAPEVSVDVTTWRGRNSQQWEKMKNEAEVLIVCNGIDAQLYHHGMPVGGLARLPFDSPETWNEAGLISLLQRFLELRPTPVTHIGDLSRRLAFRTADLRDRLLWLLDQSGAGAEAAKGGYAAWRRHVSPNATPRDFADGISQVIAYGMVLAALSPIDADADHDDHLTVAEARAAIRPYSPVLAAAFAPLVDKPALFEAVEVELGALETLVSAIDQVRINASADRRGDPWLYFYEDFLSIYDPDERRQAGVYYTPVDIVAAMTAMTHHLLINRLGRSLGFADSSVVTLDPAAGTGTFPLAVIDKAVQRSVARRGVAGEEQAAVNLGRNLFAFELLPGPYSVAHLRLTQRLRSLSDNRVPEARVILTDTLSPPLDEPSTAELFGDAEVLAAEQARARSVKLDQRVTVVMGNPPYRRVERDLRGRGSGGWVLDGAVPGRANETQSLFDDILDVARAHTIFSHHASLYNLYVYFWRWAIWKAFEANGEGPGIVSFITASSWLHGPGFVGLRQLVRQICDEVWVIDLGGDNYGANPEENVFAIGTPVAVVTMVRTADTNRGAPARVNYRRVRGTSEGKLAAMRAIAEASDPFAGEWTEAPSDWLAVFVPSTGDAQWEELPILTDIFPWQQPGCKFGRTWPIAPSKELLEQRWTIFASSPPEQRSALFVTATSGRNVTTKVAGLPKLADVRSGEESRPIGRYAYRSFDRQWAFDDPRMAKTDSPSLWQSSSDRQVYLSSILTKQIASGPALTVSASVPDLHYYCGRGGKDIIPLWRDAGATQPNMAAGLGRRLGELLGISSPTVEDVAAYCYALLSASAYQERFALELQTPGLRVPLTADRSLWSETVETGRELLWLHTYAERFRNSDAGRGNEVPDVEGIGWNRSVTRIPRDTSEISYDSETGILTIGDGQVSGVRRDVWDYSVSGMPVMSKWLGYRTAKGTGRAVTSESALDHIRPSEWHDDWNDELLDLIRVLTLTLDRQAELEDLLSRICDGPLIPASSLPVPTDAEREPPATIARF